MPWRVILWLWRGSLLERLEEASPRMGEVATSAAGNRVATLLPLPCRQTARRRRRSRRQQPGKKPTIAEDTRRRRFRSSEPGGNPFANAVARNWEVVEEQEVVTREEARNRRGQQR